MAGIIIWIIVLWFIVANVKKNPKNTSRGVPSQSSSPQRSQERPERVNSSQGNQMRPEQMNTSQGNQMRPERTNTFPGNQEELKRRLMEKYAGRTAQPPEKKVQPREKKEYAPQQKPDILAKAAANVAEDFEEKPISSQNIPKVNGMTEAQIVQKADELAEVDLYKIYEVPQMQQDSELMKMVSDIMAKGVDTEPAFSRDFVAEGLDMISNMTL